MADLAAAANNLRNRTETQIGRIERHRYIVHNAWAVAGSRIPVATIKRFHEAEYSSAANAPDQLVAAYADLGGAILVTGDRDFKQIVKRIPAGSKARFMRPSRISIQCYEPRAAARIEEEIKMIVFVYE